MSLSPELIAAIEGSRLARSVADATLAYPLVSALHILGIALLVGAILPVDLRLMGILGPGFDAVLNPLVRLALVGFGIAAAAGVALASVRIGDYVANPAFLIKLAVVGAAGTNALALRLAGRDLSRVVGRARARLAAALSIALWTTAILAGRWIAFA